MMRQPRVEAAAAAEQPLHLAITWADGTKSVVDLTALVRDLKVFEPLDDPATFADVRADESGWSIKWRGDVDLGADTLWRLALEQRGEAMRASDFNKWRERNKLSLDAAATALGLSRRVVAYYATGRRIIPKIVMLATEGYESSRRAVLQPVIIIPSLLQGTGFTAKSVPETNLFRAVKGTEPTMIKIEGLVSPVGAKVAAALGSGLTGAAP